MDKAPKKKKRMVLKGASAQPIKDGKIVSTVDEIGISKPHTQSA